MRKNVQQIIVNLIALAIGIFVAFVLPKWLLIDSKSNQTGGDNSSNLQQKIQPKQLEVFRHRSRDQDRQQKCLAKNIYFEARGQSRKGQIAVGLVTLNRVKHKAYPDTVCKVVHQPWQFSWLWTNQQSNSIDEPKAYQLALNIASALLSEESGIIDFTDGATHYHKNTVSPNWEDVKFLFVLGDHIFYRKKNG